MGTFKAKLRVWNPAHPEKVEGVEVFVDTGARVQLDFPLRLAGLGITSSRQIPFRTIDERVLERDVAIAYVASNGYTAPDLVVMAEEGEMEVMGARGIEGLGLAADPVQKRLVPTVLLALGAGH